MATLRALRSKPHTASVVATMTIAGATFDRMSADRSPRPTPSSSGFRPRRAHSRKTTAAMPIAAVVGIDLAQAGQQRVQDLEQALALGTDAEQRTELTRRDLHRRRRDEAGHDRMAEEVRQEAEAQQAHRHQQQPGHRRQRDRRAQEFGRVLALRPAPPPRPSSGSPPPPARPPARARCRRSRTAPAAPSTHTARLAAARRPAAHRPATAGSA